MMMMLPGDTHLLLEVWNENIMADDLIGTQSSVVVNGNSEICERGKKRIVKTGPITKFPGLDGRNDTKHET